MNFLCAVYAVFMQAERHSGIDKRCGGSKEVWRELFARAHSAHPSFHKRHKLMIRSVKESKVYEMVRN
jgi:hypothetical protein